LPQTQPKRRERNQDASRAKAIRKRIV
jgi:hypothetical protein